uniref:Ribonuclease H-like domain-containing protein n=1 Tax=Tanacetum cinerariifolium TaxID=118510 RepID=A0A699H431_TANCI|nr:ribonuclease H-like domain-containing protein [Tanacetum cinerariifolium]
MTAHKKYLLHLNPNPVSTHPMVTSFRVETNRPTYLLTLHVLSISLLLKSYVDVFNDPTWKNTMTDECNAHIKNNTWTFVPRPIKANVLLTSVSFYNDESGYFLGSSVMRDSSGMFLSQIKYVTEIFERVHMIGCNSSQTPIDTESKLGDDGDPVSHLTLYRIFTDPWEPHLLALKRILRYLHGTLDHGLQIFLPSLHLWLLIQMQIGLFVLLIGDRLLVTVVLGNNVLSLSSKRQPMLSHSIVEAEYRGVANVVAKTRGAQGLKTKPDQPKLDRTKTDFVQNTRPKWSGPVQVGAVQFGLRSGSGPTRHNCRFCRKTKPDRTD